MKKSLTRTLAVLLIILVALILIFTFNQYAFCFISRYGSEEYFAHNQDLLFYERQVEIASELEKLEL